MFPNEQEPTREEVLALYGEVMLAAQQLEEAMVGLLGVRAELSALTRKDLELTPEDVEALERLWEGLFTRTAGQLRSELKLAARVGEEVERAVHARNLLAHHYLRDHAVDLERGSARSGMATRLGAAADRLRTLAASVEAEVITAMQSAGLTDDHITTAGDARRIRYYDPAVDEAVAPEPFDN